MKKKNKKGQFYLMAAMVIIAIIMGFATVSNNARKEGIDKSKMYELFIETNFDKDKVLNIVIGDTPLSYLEKRLGELVSVYQSVEEIYIIINKKYHEEKYYKYSNIGGGWNIQELTSKPPLLAKYNFNLDENSYAVVILESNERQFVIYG